MRQALVTGANGFIGSALTLRLLKEGVAVRALCRNPARGAHLVGRGAEVIGGDVQDERSLNRAIAGCDVVFHVAAVTGGAAYSYNVNVIGAQNVIRAAYRAGAARFVHVSTIAVYGYEIVGRIDESQPARPSPDDFYMQSKALGEAAIWDFAAKTGLPTTCVRPAMVYGPGSAFWSRALYAVCRRMPAPMVDGGRGNAHPIFIDDLVDLMLCMATHTDAPGQTFHAAPDPAPTWSEFMGGYARMAGNTQTLDIPANALAPFSGLVALAARLGGRAFDLAGTLRFWGHRVTFSMDRARAVLNWQPRTSLEDGLRLTEPWLKSLPDL